MPILTCEHCGKPACNFTLGLLKKKVYVLKALVQLNSFFFFFFLRWIKIKDIITIDYKQLMVG